MLTFALLKEVCAADELHELSPPGGLPAQVADVAPVESVAAEPAHEVDRRQGDDRKRTEWRGFSLCAQSADVAGQPLVGSHPLQLPEQKGQLTGDVLRGHLQPAPMSDQASDSFVAFEPVRPLAVVFALLGP